MKTVGIIGAMDVEIEMILKEMDSLKKHNYAGFKIYTGNIEGKKVVLSRCGTGKVNAAACTQILIDKLGVDAIVNTGIAGSLSPKIKICDVVISTEVTYHDVRKGQMINLFPNQESFKADIKLINMAIESCSKVLEEENLRCHTGLVVTGEQFVAEKVLKDRIVEEYKPLCVEMEGGAIGHVAYLNSIPFVVIRSISDNADDEATLSYEEFEKTAAHHSARIVLEMITHM